MGGGRWPAALPPRTPAGSPWARLEQAWGWGTTSQPLTIWRQAAGGKGRFPGVQPGSPPRPALGPQGWADSLGGQRAASFSFLFSSFLQLCLAQGPTLSRGLTSLCSLAEGDAAPRNICTLVQPGPYSVNVTWGEENPHGSEARPQK